VDTWRQDAEYAQWAMVQHANRLYQSLQGENTDNLPTEADSEWWVLYVDPITQVYYALWSLLEAHEPLAQLVKVGNRIKFSGATRDPVKAEVSDADLPELRIVPVSSTPHLQRTSNASSILKRLRIEVSTGDQRVDAGLFAMEWEIYRALSTWAATLTALTWNSKKYVRLARPVTVQDGTAQADLERGIRGWAAVWECEVEMWFDTADMQSDEL